MDAVEVVFKRIPYSDKEDVVLSCINITANYSYDFFHLHGENNRIVLQDTITKELATLFFNWHTSIFENSSNSFKTGCSTSAKIVCYRDGVEIRSYNISGVYPIAPPEVISYRDSGKVEVVVECTFDYILIE